jgi:hypothetical protein
MKQLLLIALSIFAITTTSRSQKVNVPPAVTKAFNGKYPNATNIKWGKENAKEYEAEFKLNNTAISVNFGLDGSWVETETTIRTSDLPTAVAAAITKKYPGAAFIITEKIEKASGKFFYEVVIKVNGKKKEIELRPDGSFVK